MNDGKTKRGRAHWYVGLGVAVAGMLVLGGGYLRDKSSLIEALAALALIVITAAVCVFLAWRRFFAWTLGTVAGFTAGVISALELFVGPAFQRQFFVALATAAFFTVFGLIIGLTAEFIRLLHFLAHGGKILEYNRPRKERSAGPGL